MKILLRSTILILLMVGASSCSHNADVPMGNGFFTRGSGVTFELHPANFSLHLKGKIRSKLVWPSLVVGWGGPIPIEEGMLFVARNQAQDRTVFVANEHGVVAEMTANIPGLVGGGLRMIKEVGDKVQIDVWDSVGNPQTITLTGSELMKIAEKVIGNGKNVSLGNVEFYR